MIRFLIKLSTKNERTLITIPKIISIINNLLANYNIRDVAIQALKTLTYELFLMASTQTSVDSPAAAALEAAVKGTPLPKRSKDDPNSLAAIVTDDLLTLNNELDTQKEVILGMLEKFIESTECQQVLSLLLLIEQLQQQQHKLSIDANIMSPGTKGTPLPPSAHHCMVDIVDAAGGCLANKQHNSTTTCLPNLDTVCNMICHSICSNRLHIQDWNTYSMVDTFFKNNTKYLLGNSREFMALLKYIIEGVS